MGDLTRFLTYHEHHGYRGEARRQYAELTEAERDWSTADLAAAHKDAARIDAATAALRPLAPAGGSYVSESNYFNKDWRRAFWGPNYPRLAAIKAKYDPSGLFIFHHGVGSEGWSLDGFTRLS